MSRSRRKVLLRRGLGPDHGLEVAEAVLHRGLDAVHLRHVALVAEVAPRRDVGEQVAVEVLVVGDADLRGLGSWPRVRAWQSMHLLRSVDLIAAVLCGIVGGSTFVGAAAAAGPCRLAISDSVDLVDGDVPAERLQANGAVWSPPAHGGVAGGAATPRRRASVDSRTPVASPCGAPSYLRHLAGAFLEIGLQGNRDRSRRASAC